MSKCINCRKEYSAKALCNFNLDLCDACYKKLEDKIERDEPVEKVFVTCPKCKQTYERIVDMKCKTKGCNVHFFWNTDHSVVARWIDL